ncbi:asparagine synthase (glutamine-hydrolyzing) [Clostridium chromiireducens]|nr:asparagine synthase (glutamine-hydrolyzing) [Clostridium chromiireducens]
MCGILGLISKTSQKLNNEDVILMRDKMEHRGPDDAGLLMSRNDRVALAHRRLSILDLSAAGHQPMKSMNGNYICFNGEIYNYMELLNEFLSDEKIKSKTDTEVLLKIMEKYGTDCLNELNGMWSFIYYDVKNEQLIISRDRFGVKPLYYYEDDKIFIVSSEIKPILDSPYYEKKLNENSANIFLQTGLVDGIEDTFFEGIKRFPSSHYMIYSLKDNNRKLVRYYNLKESIYDVSDNYEENVKKFRELFIDSVRLRLRSDVPVGNCLSGGLDSSSIYSVVSNISDGEVHSFSSKYEEEECDESYFYNSVITMYPGINHETIPSYDNFEEKLKKIMYYIEEPCKAYGIISMWNVIELAKPHVKVLLDGQGGDEVLAGYDFYLWYYILDLLDGGIEDYELSDELQKIEDKKGYEFINSISTSLKSITSNGIQKFNNSYVNEKLFEDLTTYMIPAFLRYEDKIGMAFSIEARFPFLDYRLVNFIFSLASTSKIKNGWSKAILRDAMKDILHEEVCWRKDKKGYPTPIKNILEANPSMKKYIPNNIPDDEWIKWRFISFNVWRSVYNL